MPIHTTAVNEQALKEQLELADRLEGFVMKPTSLTEDVKQSATDLVRAAATIRYHVEGHRHLSHAMDIITALNEVLQYARLYIPDGSTAQAKMLEFYEWQKRNAPPPRDNTCKTNPGV